MEDKRISQYLYEGTVARFERINKRLIIAIILAIMALVGTNLAWFLWWLK